MLAVKNLGKFGKLQAIHHQSFLPFSQLLIELCMASYYPWQNIWPLVHDSIFSSDISTSSLQYCSYYRTYLYTESTITSILCHDSTFP